MSKILVYTFYTPRLICFKITRDILDPSITKLYLGNTNTLIKNIVNKNYDYVLGLGNYRKNARNIRIETVFQNKHGNHAILAQESNFLYSTGICRLVRELLLQKS